MNKENAKQYIPLLEALSDGELQVECSGKWMDASIGVSLSFDLPPERYRRKPKPREWWVNRYENGSFGQLWLSKDKAEGWNDAVETIKVREVLE